MDEKSLAERVAVLGSTTEVIMKRHVEGIEARFGETSEAERVAKLSTAQASPVEASNTLATSDEAQVFFTNAGAIFPPYDPDVLVMLFEHSNALRSNVDSYRTNIESYGHRFEPVLDLEANDAEAKIGDAMFLERLHAAASQEVPQAPYPTPEEIANRKKEIVHAMRLERAKLETLFEEAVPESSFEDLREKTRSDLEVTGNGYWEVLRNARGEVAQFTYVPSHSMRLIPIDATPVDVRVRSRVSALSYDHTTKRRRFRRFVQVVANRAIFFKEYGDTRAMDARDGRVWPSVEAMQKEAPGAVIATEICHFAIHSPRTPYGVPRWIGNLLSVLGSRSSEEVNYLYFDNKAVPPLAVLVSGGRLTDAAVKRIESYVDTHLKGKANFHKILIIEAETAGQSGPGMADAGKIRIELKPLTDAQQQDALFQDYDERNIDKLGSSFRLPRLLRGDVRDFNRATAEAALEFAEMQVFQPERARFDLFVNRQILASLGVRFWRFVSNTPVSKDPTTLATIIAQLVIANVLTPKEAREIARDVFNRELKNIDEDWTKLPVALTLAGLVPAAGPSPADVGTALAGPSPTTNTATAPAPAGDRHLAAVAANLAALRDKLTAASAKAAERIAVQSKREHDEGEIVTIPVAKAEIDSWFEPEEAAG